MEAEASQEDEDGYGDDCEDDSQCQENDEMFEADFINDDTPARPSQAPRG